MQEQKLANFQRITDLSDLRILGEQVANRIRQKRSLKSKHTGVYG